MSEFNKTDVGDFLVNRTKNFEKSPPDLMWLNIENQIPKYTGSNSLIKYYIGGIGLSVIILSMFFVFYRTDSTSKNKTSKLNSNTTESSTKQDHFNNSTINSVVAINSENKIAEVKSSKLVANNNVQETVKNTTPRKHENIENSNNSSEKSIKYSINASGLKEVSEISFENEKKEKIISIQNPVPNAFGFFDIDISKLPSGIYNIYITVNGNKTLHKTETFK